MIFLPASLIASVFGMNVREISPGTLGTIGLYAQITIALTAFTFYVVVMLQTHTSFHERGAPLRKRAAWPILLPWKILRNMEKVAWPHPPRKANLRRTYFRRD
ncbi:hypothetical protein AZE42_07555 [Rhizopogon vesiculosus]|uniref:Uncharacterized protein n=1 Tax=Rhizopogon vesiculosus TaxID=180088 RepID=A0A1J8Q511_9AGAM|nr:hypothetical protein AZE42_07555 [Rhizopogon vesiculosus]